MDYRREMIDNKENSILGYIGAAVLGLVLSTMFHLVTGGQVLLGAGIYIIYIATIMLIDTQCRADIKWACQFNEFWITLEELVKNKLS